MTKFILNAKHWQIFILTFGVQFFGIILYAIAIISSINFQLPGNGGNNRDVLDFSIVAIIFLLIAGLVNLFGVFIHFFWLWTIGTKLQEYYPSEVKEPKIKRFKLFFLFPFIYLLFMPLLVLGITSSFGFEDKLTNPSLLILSIIILVACHFFCMFCIIHTLYFCAKKLKTILSKKEAHFSDYIGEFFMVWFFPIGVWIIQPQINKLINGGNKNDKVIDNSFENF